MRVATDVACLYMKDLRNRMHRSLQGYGYGYTYAPIEVIGDKIYMFTNYNAPKYRLMTADINKPALKDWTELVPESENVLSDAGVIGEKLFLTYDKDAANHAYVYAWTARKYRKLSCLRSVP